MRWIFRLGVLTGTASAAALIWMYASAVWAARGRLYGDPYQIPATPAAMVLGTSPRSDGRENPYFRFRMDAAAALWKAGKVKTLIVSGDKDVRAHYDEPEKMRRELVKLGVPNEKIVSHNSGFSTLDSVAHAKQTFGLRRVIFVSQQFHNERAIYLARAMEIDALGLNARDVKGEAGLPTHFREFQARVKMWLDVHLLGTRPDRIEPKVKIPR